MRNKNYRLTLELSKLSIATFTIIKSSIMHFFQLKKKKKTHKYPFSNSELASKRDKIRPNPFKIPFHPVSKFPDIYPNPNALLTPWKTFTLTQPLPSPHSILPRRIHRRHPISNFDTELPAENVNTLYWKRRGGRIAKQETILDMRSHAERWLGIHRNDATLPKWCRVTLLIFG